MPRYRYTGTNFEGRPIVGERDATDPDALLGAIRGELRHVDSIVPVGSPDPAESLAATFAAARPAPAITAGDAGEISRHLSELIESGLPLETGLAAIAAECPSRRMRGTLSGIVAELSSGSDLEQAMAACGAPPELRALVRAGARSGDTGQILEHYVTNVQSARELRESIVLGLAYPAVVLLVFSLLGVLIFWWIVPQFVEMFDGFDLDLPELTKALVVISDFFNKVTVWVAAARAAGLLALFVFFALLLRAVLGPVNMRRLICRIPVVGQILRWVAMARFTQLLSLLVENRVPLGEALVLAGDASRDAEIQDDCRKILVGVNSGETLQSAARRLRRFPPSFVQTLGWEERSGGLPEVLQSLGDMYAGRVRAMVAVLVAFLPPFLMMFLGISVGLLVIALFMPLVRLLSLLA